MSNETKKILLISFIPYSGTSGLHPDTSSLPNTIELLSRQETANFDSIIWDLDRPMLIFTVSNMENIANQILSWSCNKPEKWFTLYNIRTGSSAIIILLPDLANAMARHRFVHNTQHKMIAISMPLHAKIFIDKEYDEIFSKHITSIEIGLIDVADVPRVMQAGDVLVRMSNVVRIGNIPIRYEADDIIDNLITENDKVFYIMEESYG